MYKGIGNPIFIVKLKSNGSTVETIELNSRYILERQDLSHTERYDLDEENPLTQAIVAEPVGWYYKERMTAAVSDIADSYSVWIAKQKVPATENIITTVIRLEQYSDAINPANGDDLYEIDFWPHKDARDSGLLDNPYLVKVDIESLVANNRKSNDITFTVYGLEFTTQWWTDFTTVGFTGEYEPSEYSAEYFI